jgi:phospholipid transport system substrate-binding protein
MTMRTLLAALVLYAGWLVTALAGPAPDVLVSAMTQQFLSQAGKPGATEDLTAIRSLVQSVVMPNLDFRAMTARAVGRQWQSASEAQKSRLVNAFQALLTKTYAGALGHAAGATFKLKSTLAMDPSTTLVRSEIRSPNAPDPIELDYRLALEDGEWRITDVSVLGIWLVEVYQTQFVEAIASSGIDGLVKTLEAKGAPGP